MERLEKDKDSKKEEKKMKNNQLKMGLKVEREHKDVYDFMKKGCKVGRCPSFKQFREKTVQDHLKEDKRYYTKLKGARL